MFAVRCWTRGAGCVQCSFRKVFLLIQGVRLSWLQNIQNVALRPSDDHQQPSPVTRVLISLPLLCFPEFHLQLQLARSQQCVVDWPDVRGGQGC
jgi:hypothetical protein